MNMDQVAPMNSPVLLKEVEEESPGGSGLGFPGDDGSPGPKTEHVSVGMENL